MIEKRSSPRKTRSIKIGPIRSISTKSILLKLKNRACLGFYERKAKDSQSQRATLFTDTLLIDGVRFNTEILHKLPKSFKTWKCGGLWEKRHYSLFSKRCYLSNFFPSKMNMGAECFHVLNSITCTKKIKKLKEAVKKSYPHWFASHHKVRRGEHSQLITMKGLLEGGREWNDGWIMGQVWPKWNHAPTKIRQNSNCKSIPRDEFSRICLHMNHLNVSKPSDWPCENRLWKLIVNVKDKIQLLTANNHQT